MIKTCKKCGKEFDGTKYANLCLECRLEVKREGVVQPHICNVCGKTFEGGPKSKFCPDCRGEQKKKYMVKYVAEKKAAQQEELAAVVDDYFKVEDIVLPQEPVGNTLTQRECVVCGKHFTAQGKLKTCSTECSKLALTKYFRDLREVRHGKKVENKNKYSDANFNAMFTNACKCDTINDFIAEWQLSPIFAGMEESAITIKLKNIWELAHFTIRELRDSIGMSRIDFANRFCIPLRTAEHWEVNDDACAPYLRLALARLCWCDDMDDSNRGE